MLPLAFGSILVEDLNYLFHRQQMEFSLAESAPCGASRASHRGLAKAYAKRITHYRARGAAL